MKKVCWILLYLSMTSLTLTGCHQNCLPKQQTITNVQALANKCNECVVYATQCTEEFNQTAVKYNELLSACEQLAEYYKQCETDHNEHHSY